MEISEMVLLSYYEDSGLYSASHADINVGVFTIEEACYQAEKIASRLYGFAIIRFSPMDASGKFLVHRTCALELYHFNKLNSDKTLFDVVFKKVTTPFG